MGRSFLAAPPLVEPYSIRPIAAHGATHIQVIGSAMSFTLYLDQVAMDGQSRERAVVGRLFMSLEGVAALLPEVFAKMEPAAKIMSMAGVVIG